MIGPIGLMLFVAPGMLFALWANGRVQSAFRCYSKVKTKRGYTGAEAARVLLDQAGLSEVEIVSTRGFLADHYDPKRRRLALSEEVYGSNSVAAVGVATHEAGHAIQHATGYGPLGLRSALVPTAGIGASIGWTLMLLGVFLSFKLLVAGILLYSTVLAFQLVTLPVEFDASARSKNLLVSSGIIEPGEREGVDAVLNAAAWTYVAAALTTALELLYFLFRAMGSRH